MIKFYDKNKPYYEFSNFYLINVIIDGRVWPSTEHYYQAMKYTNILYQEIIRKADTPYKAFVLGRKQLARGYFGNYKLNKHDTRTLNEIMNEYTQVTMRHDWDTAKIDVMITAVGEKFDQNSVLQELLVNTGDKQIIEHSPRDNFWGMHNGVGQNNLGKILMGLREQYKN